MSWRTVVITKQCRLSYKNNYLIIRNEENKMIHLSEVHTLIVDSTLVSITSYLISELMKRKIKVIFCDERRNPQGELIPYYGSHNTSKRLKNQIVWNDDLKGTIWTMIVKQKILNQASLLREMELEEYKQLQTYIHQVEYRDCTNREGHAAKVYFNSLFGKEFNRSLQSNINAALDYGYSIILSTFNKEIVSNGYMTQVGIHHRNEFNHFNLSSDLMEPFRVLVDRIVYMNQKESFDMDYKMQLVNLLNQQINMGDKKYYLANAIEIFIKSIFRSLEEENLTGLLQYQYEL